ncbi:MAG: IS110 family transposase [Mycobacterium sp.]
MVGVDTHSDVHVAVAVDELGRRLSVESFHAGPDGYVALEHWATRLGPVMAFGIEGTGSWGAALTRQLRAGGHHVVEVNRPDRSTRRRHGKSDPIDAEAAARAVPAGTATSVPKAGDGKVEMIRALQVARRSAQKARSQAANQLRALLVTAPAQLREQLRAVGITELVNTAARWRTGTEPGTHLTVIKHAMRSLARRHQQLTDEIHDLDAHLRRLIGKAAPDLIAVKGLGPVTCAALLIAVGDNPERLRSESAFAHLCGVAPIPASSGKTTRHRLNRGGNRQANYALYILAITRLAWDPRTRAYAARRRAEGKSNKDIIRCLKRHIAREIYRLLTATNQPNSTSQPALSAA